MTLAQLSSDLLVLDDLPQSRLVAIPDSALRADLFLKPISHSSIGGCRIVGIRVCVFRRL